MIAQLGHRVSYGLHYAVMIQCANDLQLVFVYDYPEIFGLGSINNFHHGDKMTRGEVLIFQIHFIFNSSLCLSLSLCLCLSLCVPMCVCVYVHLSTGACGGQMHRILWSWSSR